MPAYEVGTSSKTGVIKNACSIFRMGAPCCVGGEPIRTDGPCGVAVKTSVHLTGQPGTEK